MIKRVLFIFSFLYLSCSLASMAGSEFGEKAVRRNVAEFVRLFNKNRKPTVADYDKFCGFANEEELMILNKVCKTKGWARGLGDERCRDLEQQRYENRSQTPSLYMAWLRSKFPLSPEFVIKSIKPVMDDGWVHHYLVSASWNGLPVELTHAGDQELARYLGLACFAREEFRQINQFILSQVFNKALREKKVSLNVEEIR